MEREPTHDLCVLSGVADSENNVEAALHRIFAAGASRIFRDSPEHRPPGIFSLGASCSFHC